MATVKQMMEQMMKNQEALMKEQIALKAESKAMFDSLEKRVAAIEGGKVKSTTSKDKTKKEKTVEDYEPKKDDEGFYIWASYKLMRSAYCYNQQGCKTWKGKVTKPEGFEFNKEKWEKDKKVFENEFKYIKKADR